MSTELLASPETTRENRPIARRSRTSGYAHGAASFVMAVVRLAIGVVLCTQYVTSVLAVGWTFRLMRRRTLRSWWKVSPRRAEVDFGAFAGRHGLPVSAGWTPRWLIAERFQERVRRPAPDGSRPGRLRMTLRLPRALVGSLAANFRAGLAALACTYAATLPGCLLWSVAWYDGWNNSFQKGYEQAFVGPSIGLLGSLLFIAAMLYVPTAWGHLAAVGDPRAFFDFKFVARLIRGRIGANALFAATFALLTLPATILKVWPLIAVGFVPELETASPERVAEIASWMNLASAAYLFPAFVVLHLLAARTYRKSLLKQLERDPELASALRPGLFAMLDELSLLSAVPVYRRNPVITAALGTGRLGWKATAWTATVLLWSFMVAQFFLAAFLVYHPYTEWMIQPTIHLPSLPVVPTGDR